MDIKVFASSSSGNAYRVSDGETDVLIECGIPWRRLQEHCEFKTSDLAACLLTHEHQDHSKAAKQIIQNGIDLYCSLGTALALGLSGHRVHPVEPLVDFQVGSWVIRPFDVQHDCAQPYGWLLRSMKTHEILLFAADTYYIKYRFSGMTHIMIEANYDYDLMDATQLDINKRVIRSHMSIETLKEFIRVNDMTKVKQIYLLHLSDARSNADAFKETIQMLTGAEVYTDY